MTRKEDLQKVNDSFINLSVLDRKKENNSFLRKKKKSLLGKFRISTSATGEKLSYLVGCLYLTERWQDIIIIGKTLESFENENSLNGVWYSLIESFYIYCLKFSEQEHKDLIKQRIKKMKEYISENALDGSGLEGSLKELDYFYPDSTDQERIWFFIGVIYECLFLLHLSVPQGCQYSKAEIESYFKEYTQKAKELLEKLK